MRFVCLFIITLPLLAEACVPFGGGASCGAPPCAPPPPSCGFGGFGGGCSVPLPPPPAPSCGFGGVGCSPPVAPPVSNCAFGGDGCNPPLPPPPALSNCGLGGCSQPAPSIVSCGPSGCSPPVAVSPSVSNCGPGQTGCTGSNNNGNNNNGDVHYEGYEYYEEGNEHGGQSGESSKTDCGSSGCSGESGTSAPIRTPAHNTEAPVVTDAEYEQTEATEAATEAPAKTEAPVEETPAPVEETEAPAYTEAPKTVAPSAAPVTEAQGPDNAPCQFLTCNFEEGSLCLYQSRGFEKSATNTAAKPYAGVRNRRNGESDFEHPKPWVAWMGRFGNRVTGIIEAKEGSTFAASYLKPGQSAIMETDILFVNGLTIKFDAYEATADIALRMCCDSVEKCHWETSKEADESSRKWRPVESTCPAGTKKVLFVCQNNGLYQGACGLDNIRVDKECSQIAGKKTAGLQPFALSS